MLALLLDGISVVVVLFVVAVLVLWIFVSISKETLKSTVEFLIGLLLAVLVIWSFVRVGGLLGWTQ